MHITETRFSSIARAETDSPRNPISNGTANIRMEKENQQEPISNGISKTTVPPTTKTTQTVISAIEISNSDKISKIQSHSQNGDIKPKIEKM